MSWYTKRVIAGIALLTILQLATANWARLSGAQAVGFIIGTVLGATIIVSLLKLVYVKGKSGVGRVRAAIGS